MQITGGPSISGSARSGPARCRVAGKCRWAASLASFQAIAKERLTSAGRRCCDPGGRWKEPGSNTTCSTETFVRAGRVGAGSLGFDLKLGCCCGDRCATPGVSATQDGLEPAVALAVAGRVGTTGGPEARERRQPRVIPQGATQPRAKAVVTRLVIRLLLRGFRVATTG